MVKWLISLSLVAALAGLVGWRIGAKGTQGDQPGGGMGAMASGGGRGGASAAGGGSGRPPGGAGPATAGGGGGGGRGGTAKVELAVSRAISDAIEVVGTIESPFTVEISPKVSGRIEYLVAREGDPVVKGQVLARIDATELRAQVAQQEANLAQARSRLAEASLMQGPTSVGVQGQVRQEQAGVASAKAELTQAERSAEAQVAAAQAKVTQADAGIRAAEALLRNAEAELKRDQATLATVRSRLARSEQLFQKGYVSQQQLEEVRNQVTVAESSVNVASGRVESARSAVEVAKAGRTSNVQDLEIAKRRGVADVAAAKARLVQANEGLALARANRAENPAFAQSIAALRANVNAASAQLQQARTRLNDATLRSPIDGHVTAREGNPGSLASVGQAILTVQYLDWLYVTASLSESQIGKVRERQRAEASFSAFPGRTFPGFVEQINAAADPESRQFLIRVRFPNPGRELKPGMFGNLRLLTRTIQNAVVVPKEAVKTTDAGSTVTVVDSEGNADIRQVVLGASDSRGVQIVSGVRAGEKVVTLAFTPPRQGQPVRTGERAGQGGQRGASGQSSGRASGPGGRSEESGRQAASGDRNRSPQRSGTQ